MANELHTLTIGSTSYPIRPLSVETYAAKSGSDKPSTYPAGFSTNMVYGGMDTGWPYDYGNALTIKGLGTTQLMMSWNAAQTSTNSAVPQSIYLRSQRDSAGDNWSDWTLIMTNDLAYTKTQVNDALGTKADKDGSNAGGTWGINITGKANTAGTADSASSVPWTGVSGKPTALSQFTNDSGFITGSPNSIEMTGVSGQKAPFIDFHHYDTVGNDYDYRIICSAKGGTTYGGGTCTFEGLTRFKGAVTPHSNNTYYLGNSTYKWANVYATTFTGNLTGNVTGNCSGSSGSCTGNAATATTAASLDLGENCSITRYASPYNDGGVDSIKIHGHYSVDVDSDFYVDSPYNTRMNAGDDTGGISELNLSKDNVTLGNQFPSTDEASYITTERASVLIRAENNVEYSRILVSQKRIQMSGSSANATPASMTLGDDASISLGGTLCTAASGMTFRPYSTSGTTNLGASSYYWTNGYITTIRSTTAYSTNGFYESSDERLKNFGGRISVDLDKISRLKKHYFEWKNGQESGTQIGVSAQEIKELYPELVKENEDGYLTVAYDKLSVVALAAVDELHKKNKELEDRIAKLEAIVNKLIDNE